MKFAPVIAFLFFIISATSFAGTSMPSTFTYQGRLMNAAGNAALIGNLTLYIEIKNPSGSCLLYSEHQAVNTTTTNGLFSIQIGSGTRTNAVAGYDDDPNYQFSEIFTNKQDFAVSASCAGGWTPGTTDARMLRIHVYDGSTTTTLADQVLSPVPQASVADTIDGVPLQGLTLNWTTVTRPTNPVSGMHGYNDTLSRFEKWNGAAWVSTTPKFSANAINDTATDNYVLKWNDGTDTWEPSDVMTLLDTPGGDVSGTIANMTVEAIQGQTVAATAPNSGEVLKWNGSEWEAAPDTGGIVSIATAPGNNNKLSKYTTAGTQLTDSSITDDGTNVTMTIPLDMSAQQIKDVANPTDGTDAATKDYVDTAVGSAGTTTIAGGTQNYVTKFNAAGDNVVNSQIFDDGANVGIGTATPTHQLVVSGSANNWTKGVLKLSNTNAGTGAVAGIIFDTDAAGADNGGLYIGSQAFTGNAYAQNRLTLDGDNSAGLSLLARGASSDIRFHTGGTTERMRIDNNGNVGIGTATPDRNLSLFGATTSGLNLGATSINHGMTVSGIKTTTSAVLDTTSTGGAELLGIGGDTSTVPLRLSGIFGSASPTAGNSAVIIDGVKKFGVNIQPLAASDRVMSVTNAGTNLMTVLGSGNVSIGANNPNEKLTVEGVLSLKESADPTLTAGYGKIFVKPDNTVWYMDEAGTPSQFVFGSGAGEVNTANNVGAGVGVWKEKSGADLRFKSLTPGASSTIAVTADAGGNEIDIDLAQNGASTEQVMKWNGTNWAPAWNSSLSASDGSPAAALTIDADGVATLTATHTVTAGDDIADKDYVDAAVTAADVPPVADGTTAGQTLRWDGDSWEPMDTIFVDGDSEVGIGTTTPAAKFNLVQAGQTSAQGILIEEGATDIRLYQGTSNDGYLTTTHNLVVGSDATGNKTTTVQAGRSLTLKSFNDALLGNIIFDVGGERMRVHNDGNVGIGVTIPTAKLHLPAGTTAASTAPLKFEPTAATLMTAPENGAMEFDGTDYYLTAGGTRRKIATSSGGSADYVLKTGDTMTGPLVNNSNSASTALAVTQAGAGHAATFMGGNVGVGTATPGALLNLTSESTPVLQIDPGSNVTADPTIYLKDTAANNGFKLWYDNDQGNTYFDLKGDVDSYRMYFRTKVDGTPLNAMTILGSGNVGIGTTTPASELHVNKTAPTGSVTSTGTAVTGTGTNFTSVFSVGDQFLANGQTKTITAIADATNLTVNTAFSSDLAAGTGYESSGAILNSGNIGIGTSSLGTSRVKISSNGFANDKVLEVTGSGIAGGQAGPFYGVYVNALSNNNATSRYGVYAVGDGGGHGSNYGVYGTTTMGSSTRLAAGVQGHVLVNAGATNNGPHLLTPVAGVLATAATYNTDTQSTTTALLARNESTSGLMSYGAYIDALPGPTTVVPLRIDYNTSEILRVTSAGNMSIGTTSANEKLTVSGNMSLAQQGSVPAATANFGKVYVSGDGASQKLYFKNENNDVFDLTGASGGVVSSIESATGAVDLQNGATGTAPNWAQAGSNVTLHIPLASGAGVTSGTISKTDYDRIPAAAVTTGNVMRWNGTAWVETDGINIEADGDAVLKNQPTANMHAATKEYVDAEITAHLLDPDAADMALYIRDNGIPGCPAGVGVSWDGTSLNCNPVASEDFEITPANLTGLDVATVPGYGNCKTLTIRNINASTSDVLSVAITIGGSDITKSGCTDTCTGQTLAPNATCTVAVRGLLTGAGSGAPIALSAQIQVSASGFDPATANLSGTASADPCYNGTAAKGDVCAGGAIYAGVYNSNTYMVMPSGCDMADTSNPLCTGGTDSLPNGWLWSNPASDFPDVENVAAAATHSTMLGDLATNNIIGNNPAAQDAKFCYDLVLGGYSDWYLPAKSELAYIMCNSNVSGVIVPQEDPTCAGYGGKTTALTGFYSGGQMYSTSTEFNANYIWSFHTGSGGWYSNQVHKTVGNSRGIRCVRRY